MRSVRTAVGALTTAILVWPGVQARAEPQPTGPSAIPAIVAVASPDPAPSASAASSASMASTPSVATASEAKADPPSVTIAAFGKPVASEKLDDIRGGAEVVVNDMRLSGVVADNSANRVFTGSNAINEGSFANASGLPTVIQNTGANTLIQNATIINVQFKP